MQAQSYTTKGGLKQFRPVVTEEEMFNSHGTGFCLACGAEAEGVEPDARRYTCESCEAPKVYGLEELLMMGLLKIAEDSD